MVYYAVCYVTPASRLGGELPRIYMLNKECEVDYKTGSTVVLLDKMMEIFGSSLFGILGLFILFSLEIPLSFKLILSFLIIIAILILFLIYYRTIKNKGSFSSVFKFLFNLQKPPMLKFYNILIDIENKMNDFFTNHKTNFFGAFVFYLIGAIFFFIEWKILLLALGFNASIPQLILIISVWGITNFIPTPASLGFFEAGQSGLFHILRGSGSEGLANALMLRVGYLIAVLMGFLIMLKFFKNQIFNKILKGIKNASKQK